MQKLTVSISLMAALILGCTPVSDPDNQGTKNADVVEEEEEVTVPLLGLDEEKQLIAEIERLQSSIDKVDFDNNSIQQQLDDIVEADPQQKPKIEELTEMANSFIQGEINERVDLQC